MSLRRLRHQQLTLTKDNTTGWTATATPKWLGVAGKITRVVVRLDATNDDANTIDLVVALSGLDVDSTTPDEQKIYEYTGLALTGSATASSLDDNVGKDGGADYGSFGPGAEELYLTVAANVTDTTGGAGATSDIYVDIWSEVD